MTIATARGFAPPGQIIRRGTAPKSQSINDFKLKIEREFVEGSAIHPALYSACVQVVPDLVISAGGEVNTPIHDALGWRYTRFGNQVRATLYAALLVNEDGSCWQAKLSSLRIDPKKQTYQKYETPVGNGSRAFLPSIPSEIRQLIAQRYGVDVPEDGSFWSWYAANPELEIPLILTEGGKKALALLSQGYVAIALYGVNGGYRNIEGIRSLIPDLERFVQPERTIVLAFDQDEKTATRRRVSVALHRFGWLLEGAAGIVRVARWDGKQGKGVDDLIVGAGAAAWDRAYQDALSLVHWQLWQRLESRLTYPANLVINSANLATLQLNNLPTDGIIALTSAKGTGKTKFIAAQTTDSDRAIAAGHRVALMRNLCQRLNLDYRGDLDKVNGEFINGAAYTFRVGLCVDSLLAIDPQKFAGCDLILDEAVQVIRHLLTSSTCARDGKRPALLGRFADLVRQARRILVADADLNNATLNYLKELRDEETPVFLIRNTYQPQGYPVRFIDAPDRSSILDDLMVDVGTLPAGQVLYIATDSKGTSKAIARLIQQQYPEKRTLLINSETSGGECEQAFMQAPDQELGEGHYDIILCSPSVATGVSIEAQGIISRVYGIFTGSSSADEDMAQALGRVREPVERVVWCAKTGNNFSKVSRATNAIELKRHLYDQTRTTVSLIRSSLRQDTHRGIKDYDWQSDPNVNLYCRIAAAQNASMHQLRDALLVRLRYEGNQVQVEVRETNPATKQTLSLLRLELREVEAEKLVAAKDLTYSEVLQLEQQESVSPEMAVSVSKFHLREFYGLDVLTTEDVLWDSDGRRRGEILNLEDLLFPGLSVDRAVKSLEKQARWKQYLCPWDISNAPLRRRLREELGLDKLLLKLRSGWNYTRYDLAAYARKARVLAAQIKVALHLTISSNMSDVQVVHQLLAQMGVKVQQLRWSRSVEGHEGEKLRVYGLDVSHWRKLWEVLERRYQKRQQMLEAIEGDTSAGSPGGYEFNSLVGDPDQEIAIIPDFWFDPAQIQFVTMIWRESASDSVTRLEVMEAVPGPMLRYLGLIA